MIIVTVVLPSLLYTPPLTRDHRFKCARCQKEVPFSIHKMVKRTIYHVTGPQTFSMYSLWCSEGKHSFMFPVLGLMYQDLSGVNRG